MESVRNNLQTALCKIRDMNLPIIVTRACIEGEQPTLKGMVHSAVDDHLQLIVRKNGESRVILIPYTKIADIEIDMPAQKFTGKK